MPNTEFAEKLTTALDNHHARTYIWKGRKERLLNGETAQEVVNLMDASEEQLRRFYAHCNSMLYNPDHKSPGRRPLLVVIQNQRNQCGVELFLREEEAKGTTRYPIISTINKIIRDSGISQQELNQFTLGRILDVPQQYSDLPIKLVQDGCLQKLGKFDRSHITLTFILKQGLRLTPEEEKELTEYDDKGNQIPFVDVVRQKQNIGDHMKLKMNPKGLTYTQLRAMLSLKPRNYSELTTEQLRTLRNRILFSLEDDVMFHINQWEERISQIMEVAELRDINLN
jgi:hypothetical protein